MNPNNKKIIISALFTFAFVLLSRLGYSQPPPPPPPPCWPPPCIPIDGGISFLLAAGAVYGGKKLYHSFKQ